MKVKITLVLAITIAAMLVLVGPVFADSELDGKWTGAMTAPDGNQYPLNFTFRVDGGKLTGTSASPNGDVAIEDGKINGDDFTFNVDVGGVKVICIGKLHDHVCDVNLDYQGFKFSTTLKKVADK